MTSREITIRDAIARLDPAEFQNLCQELLTQYYDYEKPVHRGSATHSGAPAKGTPDTYWILPNGKFAFLECGHYQDRYKAIEKIKEDIEKCLEVERNELGSGKVVKIIIAYSCRRIAPADADSLRALDGRVELVNADQLAKLLAHEFQHLAKEHLGISVSSGQIMGLSEFVERSESSAFASSLKVALSGRESELENLASMLEAHQVVLLHGSPGAGKTRLALEAVRRYAEKCGVDAFAIKPNGLSIWDDLASDLPPESGAAILLDDANELTELKGFADFVSRRRDVKVVMTARNYARSLVVSSLSKFCKPYVIELGPLDQEAVGSIVKDEFGVTSDRAVQAIASICKGNMRLAYAASAAVKSSGSALFSSMPDLIEACYGDALGTLSRQEMHAASIVAVLGSHLVEDNSDLGALEGLMGVTHSQYVDACRNLYKMELVDVCKNMVAVAPAEQVLRDYLLYKVFYMDRILSLRKVDDLEHGAERCPDIAAILFNTFQSDGLVAELKEQVAEIWDSANDVRRWDLIPTYNTLLGDRALSHIVREVGSLPELGSDYISVGLLANPKSHTVRSRVLAALAPFLHSTRFGDAEEVYFKIIEEDVASCDDVLAVLVQRMGFSEDSYRDVFIYENAVLDRLFDRWKATGALRYAVVLIQYAKALLEHNYEGIPRVEGNKVFFPYGEHVFDESLVSLRRKALADLWAIRKKPALRFLCDSVVTDLKGASVDGGPGELWRATLQIAYEEYLSKVDAIDEVNLPAFACIEVQLRRENVLDGLALPYLHGNPVDDAVALVYARDFYGEDETEGLEASVAELDAAEISRMVEAICKATPYAKRQFPLYTLGQVLSAWLKDWDGDELPSPDDLILAGLPTYIVPFDMSREWVGRFGVKKMRSLAMGSPESVRCHWLQAIDTMRIDSSIEAGLDADIVNGARVCGEVIDFRHAMALDAAFPGFYGKYVAAVLEGAKGDPFKLRRLMPDNYEDSDQVEFASRDDNFAWIKKVATSMVASNDARWDEKAIRFILCRDSEFAPQIVPAIVANEAMYNMEVLGDAVWHLPNRLQVVDAVWRSTLECDMKYPSLMRPRFLKRFVKREVERDGEGVIGWLASKSIDDTGDVIVPVADVAMEMPAELKMRYVLELCEGGLTPEGLRSVPMFITGFGASWMGSEVPFLRGKIEFVDEVIAQLSGVDFVEHRLVLNEVKEGLERIIGDVEVREFIRPF